MVSTRRSVQKQESIEGTEPSGPSTSSQRGRGAAGRGRGRSAARGSRAGRGEQFGPVEEDTAQNVEITSDTAVVQAVLGSVPGQGEGAGPAEQGKEAAPVKDAEASGPAGGEEATIDARAASSEEGEPSTDNSDSSESGADDSESDGDDDDDIFASSMVQNLASSLRAALQARAGPRSLSPSPPPQLESEELQGEKLGLHCDPAAVRWRPDTKPPEVVAARERVAPGVGGSKEKGLNKQLLVPPRSKGEEAPSRSERSKRWFELPATKITGEVKTELRLLRLRGAYDPKRFYKSFDETKFPTRFQIGTVVDNAQDFYSSRLTARERGASITQELLADPAVGASRKKRYAKLQQEATKFQKVKKRKTDLKRANPKPKRPKH